MSLRVRINLVITLVTIVFTIATTGITINDMRNSVREEVESATRVAVQLIETAVAGVYREPGPAERNQALLELLRRVGRVRANEIRFYDYDGKLLYQSPPTTYQAKRSAPAWFTGLVKPRIEASRLDLPGGSIVVVPDPSRSILEAWDDLTGFAWLALGFLVLINGVVFWLLDRSLKPLPKILEGLREMARGRFDVRLPERGPREFASISEGFNRMAETLKDSLARNERLALVAQQSSDAIVIRDLDGRISFCNAAATRLLEYSEEELIGSDAALITPPERRDEFAANSALIQRRKSVDLLDTQRLTKTGRLVDVVLSAAPLVDPMTDRLIGEICSLRDVTEHKRMQQAEQELERNRKFTALIQTRLEEERRAIARELHDELSQCVTAIKTIGTSIESHAGDSAPEVRDRARTIVSVASHIYDVVHGLIRRLRPSGLDHLGLGDTLRDTVSNWSQRHPEVRWDLSLAGDLAALGEAVNITVYRIVQEALTNVVRHAEATRALVSVSREHAMPFAEAIVVRIEDNGKGLKTANHRDGEQFGLVGMRERAQALGGTFEISSAPGRGVTVRAVIPLVGEEQPAQVEA